MAQGWLKILEGIYDDLQHMRQDMQQLVVSWESRRVVMAAVQDILTIDATRYAERNDGTEIWAWDNEERGGLVSAYNADRIFLTVVKLSPADWRALSRYGRLDELSLPDALWEADCRLSGLTLGFDFWDYAGYAYSRRMLQIARLLSLAAELRHPEAQSELGYYYLYGFGTEFGLDSSMLHFKIALDSGDKVALYGLSRVYDKMDEPETALKYFTRAAEHFIICSEDVVLRLTMDTRLVPNVEEARKWLNRCPEPLFQSFCHFFGIACERSEREAVLFAERMKVDDTEYGVYVRKGRVEQKCFLKLDAPDDGELGSLWSTFENSYSDLEADMLKDWFDHLFDNGLQSMVLSQLVTAGRRLVTNDQFECYSEQAARGGSSVAHLALASYFTVRDLEDQDWRRAEQHLRIAAEMEHFGAQEVCRELFGDTETPSRGVQNVEEVIELQRGAL